MVIPFLSPKVVSLSFTPQPPKSPDQDVRLITIIATYNERDNLPELVQQLRAEIPAMTILVIDDNSPDGTGHWCRQQSEIDPDFHCIHRPGKLGLGSATIAGFEFAMENGFDLIATMDADFSHDPARLPALVNAVGSADGASVGDQQSVGVAIGSRYVAGGAIEGWPWGRHLSSRMVNGFARLFLRLPTRDNSGAFRVYRRGALERIGVSKIKSDGYAYLEELLWRIDRCGIAMVEVPITFTDRTQGTSKTNLWMGVQVFWHLTKIAVGAVK